MAESVASLLLKLVGDPDDAKRALEETAAEVEAFDQLRADAEISVDTHGITRDLGLAATSVEGFGAGLAGLTPSAAGAESIIASLAGSIGSGGAGGGGLVGSLGALAGEGPLAAAGMAATAAAVVLLSGFVTALAGGVVALVASLSAAVGAVGALTVAFGASLLPMIALAIGAFERFREQSKIPGTAANELAGAVGRIKDAFARALGPGIDAVFTGLAGAIRRFVPVISSLQGGFTDLGKAIGGTFRTIADQLSNPEWQKFFREVLGGASKIVGPLGSVFVSLAKSMRNIAEAALPILVRLLPRVAQGISDFVNHNLGVKNLSGTFNTLVSHLQAWWDLGKNVARVFFGALQAAAPAGKDLVHWLAVGVGRLAKWVESAEGQRKLKDIFEKMKPIIKDLGHFGKVVVETFLRFIVDHLDDFKTFADVMARTADGLKKVYELLKGKWNLGPDFWKGVNDKLRARGGLGLTLQLTPHASGGIATRASAGIVGEAGPEAILPLSQAVLGSLGSAIFASMPPGVRAGGAGPAGRGGDEVHYHISGPASAVPDGRHTAALLERERKRRAG